MRPCCATAIATRGNSYARAQRGAVLRCGRVSPASSKRSANSSRRASATCFPGRPQLSVKMGLPFPAPSDSLFAKVWLTKRRIGARWAMHQLCRWAHAVTIAVTSADIRWTSAARSGSVDSDTDLDASDRNSSVGRPLLLQL